MIISAAGNIEHAAVRERWRGRLAHAVVRPRQAMAPPHVVPKVVIRSKELEQSHVCLGASSYPQNHERGTRATC